MKSIIEFINESYSFETEIKKEPLKLNIKVNKFYVKDSNWDDYELTDESQLDDFIETWESTTENGDDFEFNTNVIIVVSDQINNECILKYKATYEVGPGTSRTPITIERGTQDKIGLSKEDIENIISQVHNRFFDGDYAADEVAEKLYKYLYK